ncbi:hypothetical protein QQ045_005591 [Rhodiola kirilowii]
MDEVVSVLKKMPTNKATSPDGFSVEFFKASWNVCGKDILKSVTQFFRDGRMPKGINSTYLALIPNGGVLSWKGVDNCFQWKGSYDLLKGDIQEKLWAELVWADLSPPKHNFCAWLAIQNKIQTRDRLVLEGDIDRRCCWCRHHPESHEHIFFKCSSMHVLKPLFDVAGSSIHWESWDDVMEWRTQRIWKSKEEKEITSFIINAAIYEIWSNRNSTIFSNIKLLS